MYFSGTLGFSKGILINTAYCQLFYVEELSLKGINLQENH